MSGLARKHFVTFKSPGETDVLTVDVSDKLDVGETISSGTSPLGVTVARGVDASPSAILSGSPTFGATGILTQGITGGVAGTIYRVLFEYVTSNGRTLHTAVYVPVFTK